MVGRVQVNHNNIVCMLHMPQTGVKMIIGITMMGALIAVGFIAFTVAVAVVKKMKLKGSIISV